MGIGLFLVRVLLFSAWQHFELQQHGYRYEQMLQERAEEELVNRHLRLEVETLKAPARIERVATGRLRMVAPTPDDSTVIERVTARSGAAALGCGAPVGRNGVRGGRQVQQRLAHDAEAEAHGRFLPAARLVGSDRGSARVSAGVPARRPHRARRPSAVANDPITGQARRDPRSQRSHPRAERRRRHDLRRADRARRPGPGGGDAVPGAARL